MGYRNTSHLLHMVLTVLFLPWCLVWLVCTLSNNQHNRKVEMQMVRENLEEMKRNNRK